MRYPELEFLQLLGVTQNRIANDINVPRQRINEIVKGTRCNTALRLARYFGTTKRFWLNLQTTYDWEVERERLCGSLACEVQILSGAN